MKSASRILSMVLLTSFAFAFSAPVARAQELPQGSAAVKEHEWLKRFVGEWEVTSDSPSEGEPIKGKAIMKSSMLGDLWVVNSSEHEIAGMKMKSIQMIGYDPQKKKYVGIWADSFMNYMWRYEGTVDKSGNKLTLAATGPDMASPGKTANYRDAYEFTNDDTIVATSSMQDKDGKWTVIMTGKAKRREK